MSCGVIPADDCEVHTFTAGAMGGAIGLARSNSDMGYRPQPVHQVVMVLGDAPVPLANT